MQFYQVQAQNNIDSLFSHFAKDYGDLYIPRLTLGYVENLQNVGTFEDLSKQQKIFQKYARRCSAFDNQELNVYEKQNLAHLKYEVNLNLERITLAKAFIAANQGKALPNTGLYHLPKGKEWYRYFLKKWLSLDQEPQVYVDFGMKEIVKVRGEMDSVKKALGYAKSSAGFYQKLNDDQFFLTEKDSVLSNYARIDQTVKDNLSKLFFQLDVQEVKVAEIPNATKDSPPGIYHNQHFYYSFWGGKHNRRMMDFLYMHEGIPGHHFQMTYPKHKENLLFKTYFFYGAYTEGWAAYCEEAEIGHTLGLYQSPYDYWGKLEWDLVRSVRVVLDIKLNYEGWSKAQAMEFWKQHVPNQDGIAQREIDRMIRWPAQVLTYKVGADYILKLRKQYRQQEGEDFDIRKFHQKVLAAGAMPLEILPKFVLDKNKQE